MNRRQFAQSLAALGGAGVGCAVAAMPDANRAVHFVQDTRIAAFNTLDLAIRIRPTHYHTFDGDVSRLWRDVLREAWRDAQAATAGFTRYAEFFVLSTLARDFGYSVAATDEQAQYLSWLLVRNRESGAELS
jgi:hypothetical protein